MLHFRSGTCHWVITGMNQGRHSQKLLAKRSLRSKKCSRQSAFGRCKVYNGHATSYRSSTIQWCSEDCVLITCSVPPGITSISLRSKIPRYRKQLFE